MGTFIRELMQVGLYKRSQGRITRQVTFGGLALILALGLWRLSQILNTWNPDFRFGMSPAAFHGAATFGLPLFLLALCLWICYRLVNLPAFADFLIAVEAEMNKVSWPTRNELVRASVIVIIMIFALAAILATYDFLWKILFVRLGIG